MFDPVWLSGIGDLLTGSAAAAAAYIAFRELGAWREQLAWSRKLDVAETALTDFYHAQAILRQVRKPFPAPSEGASRPGRDEETEDQRRRRDVLWTPIERLEANEEFFSLFWSRRFKVMAVLGQEANEPYQSIQMAIKRIRNAAFTLSMNLDSRPSDLAEAIWEGFLKPDRVGDLISQAVDDAERIFGGVIRNSVPTRRSLIHSLRDGLASRYESAQQVQE